MNRRRKTRNRMLTAAVLLVAAALPGRSFADVDWHGFVEGGYGLRTADDPRFDDVRDYTLNETRAQLKLSSYGDRGEAFLRLDIMQDNVLGGGAGWEIREGFLRFNTLADRLEVKAGRQALTWGTGDLIFVNDLFPKDWVSFFIGREDQYLKAPADAVRLGVFGLPFTVDLVATPAFTPDRLPDGSRLSFYSPPGVMGPPTAPENEIEEGEIALRLSKYFGDYNFSLYGYRGFWKTPAGMTGGGLPYYPNLAVYGASARSTGFGGVYWLEAGYYDSDEDRNGSDPMVANSEVRMLAGYERQLATDLNATVQWYGEFMGDHDKYAAGLPEGAREQDELRQIVTLRLEKMALYHTIRLSLFTFYSPTDEDVYVRPMVSYKVTDEVEIAAGGNLFEGQSDRTQFGQFDKNDNLYTRIRYTF
ncbi:MAG: hypothetical protein ABIK65_09260 [Candidatus Eisenbacteria bacterium]